VVPMTKEERDEIYRRIADEIEQAKDFWRVDGWDCDLQEEKRLLEKEYERIPKQGVSTTCEKSHVFCSVC